MVCCVNRLGTWYYILNTKNIYTERITCVDRSLVLYCWRKRRKRKENRITVDRTTKSSPSVVYLCSVFQWHLVAFADEPFPSLWDVKAIVKCPSGPPVSPVLLDSIVRRLWPQPEHRESIWNMLASLQQSHAQVFLCLLVTALDVV